MPDMNSYSAELLKLAGQRALDFWLALHWSPIHFKQTLNALEAQSDERSDAVRALVDHLELAASSSMMDDALASLGDALPPTSAFQPLRVGVAYSLHGDAAGADAARPPGPELRAWSLPALHTAAWCLAKQSEWAACFPLAQEAAKRQISDPYAELGHERAALFGLAAHHVGEHALAVASLRRSFEVLGFPTAWLLVFAVQSAGLAGVAEAELDALHLELQRVSERTGVPKLAPDIAAAGAIAAFESDLERAKTQFEGAVEAAVDSNELADVKKLAEAVRVELGRRTGPNDLVHRLDRFVTGRD